MATHTSEGRLQRLADWFLCDDLYRLPPEELRKARTTVLIMMISIVLAPGLVIPWVKRGIPEIWVGSIAVLAALPAMLLMTRWKGTYRLAAHLLSVIYFYGFFAVLIFAGGLDGPAVPDFAIPGVMATALVGRRAGFIWLALSIAAVLTGFILTSKGLVDPNPLSVVEMNKAKVSSALVSVLAVFLFILSFDYTKERMRKELESEKERATEAHGEVQLILDNTGQGFFTLDAQGRLGQSFSQIVGEWFQRPKAGTYFPTYLESIDPAFAEAFEIGWEQLLSGELPVAVAIGQLPRRFVHAERHFEVNYRPVREDGDRASLRELVVIITNITTRIERDDARVRRQDFEALLERLIADPEGVNSFVSEAHRLMVAIETGRIDYERRRALHTLKGISATWGLHHVSRLCHELEQDFDAFTADKIKSNRHWRALETIWVDVDRILDRFKHKTGDGIRLSSEARKHLESQLRSLGDAAKPLRNWLRIHSLESGRKRLERFANEAVALSERMGKRELSVDVEDGGVRLDFQPIEALWSASAHLVRNAIDHGVAEVGGKLRLVLSLNDDALVFEVSDNGAGIDWDNVKDVATRRGLPAKTQDELNQALFSDGLSTRTDTTMTSGRGLGLAAVKAAVEKAGATIAVESTRETGTSFRIAIPREGLKVGALSLEPS